MMLQHRTNGSRDGFDRIRQPRPGDRGGLKDSLRNAKEDPKLSISEWIVLFLVIVIFIGLGYFGIYQDIKVNYDKIFWDQTEVGFNARLCFFNSKKIFSSSEESNEDNCLESCLTSPGCTHWSWSHTTKICSLNHGHVIKTLAIFNTNSSCGLLQPMWHTSNGVKWMPGCFFEDPFIKSIPSHPSECAKKCKDNPKCSHFHWTDENDGVCRMKAGEATISDAKVNSGSNLFCGVLISRNKV